MHRFQFVKDLNLVLMAFGERIDDRSLLAYLLSVYDHPDFVAGMDEIASFLGTRDVNVTASGLRDIAYSFPLRGHEHARPNLVAVVTTSKLGHGLTRLYSAYAGRDDTVTMETFRSVADAAEWLDARRGRPPGHTAAALEALQRKR